jgi:hypothetical protein
MCWFNVKECVNATTQCYHVKVTVCLEFADRCIRMVPTQAYLASAWSQLKRTHSKQQAVQPRPAALHLVAVQHSRSGIVSAADDRVPPHAHPTKKLALLHSYIKRALGSMQAHTHTHTHTHVRMAVLCDTQLFNPHSSPVPRHMST